MNPRRTLRLPVPPLLGAAALAVCLLALPAVNEAQAQDKLIPNYQLPVAVIGTMRTAVPGATYVGAIKTREFGLSAYELEGKTSNGRKLTVVVMPDGTTLAVNTTATPDEVPQEATAALRHWVSGFQPASVARSVRDGGARIWYEFLGRGAGGQPLSVEVRSDGRKITIEEK